VGYAEGFVRAAAELQTHIRLSPLELGQVSCLVLSCHYDN
jgi:hypothetical protein